MRRLIVAAVAASGLGVLSANAQQPAVQGVSPDGKMSDTQNWMFGTRCDFDATNGSIDFLLGFLARGDVAWIQGYEANENCDCIGGVMIQMFRTAANPPDMWEGREVTVYLWSDPTNDLDPSDAVLEGEAQFFVPVGRGPMFIEFPPATVTGRFWVAGSIFANRINPDDPREFPAAFNSQIESVEESWIAFNPTAIDPNDLGPQIVVWGHPFLARAMLMDDAECDRSGCVCDMNCDGEINAFDIEPFLDLLFGGAEPCCGSRGVPPFTGDTDGDGDIDAFDIEPFLECLFP